MNKQELIEKYEYMSHACFRRVDTLEVLKDLRQLDEPKKVKVPQFVADWIEVCKEHLTSSLYLAMTPSFLKSNNQGIELTLWIKKNEETFARAWLYGYEVEKEKRYIIKLKGVPNGAKFLKYAKVTQEWYFGMKGHYSDREIRHTRKELEEAGFGWVFDCEGIEIEEVTE